MDLPDVKPEFKVSASMDLADQSKVDGSMRQEAPVTINAGAGSTINANSGNETGGGHHGLLFSQVLASLRLIGVLGLFTFVSYLYVQHLTDNANLQHRGIVGQIEKFSNDTQDSITSLRRDLDEVKASTEEQIRLVESNQLENVRIVAKKSYDGTIWVLRRDLLTAMDYYTNLGKITPRQYELIGEQFRYYRSIGGNHGVEARYEEFRKKVVDTNEIRMGQN